MTSYQRHADFYEQHATRLYCVMLKITRDPEMAEDIVQDSFIKLMECYPTLSQQKVMSLLNVSAKRTLIDRCRHQKLIYQHITRLEDWHHEIPDNEWSDPQESCPDHLLITGVLAHLSPCERHLLELVVAGYSYAQIAEVTGYKQSGIKTRIKRARDAARLHYQRAIEEDAA